MAGRIGHRTCARQRRTHVGSSAHRARALLLLTLLLAAPAGFAQPSPASPPARTEQRSVPPAAGVPAPARVVPAAPTTVSPAPISVAPSSAPTGRTPKLPRPIAGAFGIRFDAALPAYVRGGASPASPLPLPQALNPAPVSTRPGIAPVWVAVRPPTIPQLLLTLRPSPNYAVLLDDARVPVRITGEVDTPRCQSLFVALGKHIAERYGEALPASAPPGVQHFAQFLSAKRYVQIACSGQRLAIEYIDGAGVQRWRAQHEGRIAAYDRRQRLALAARVAPERSGLMGSAFGIEFARPCAIAGVIPDINADVAPPEPFASWPGARYELMVDPEGFPIRISAIVQFVDVEAAAAERARIVAALVERYGKPRRNKPTYAVVTRAGRHAVVLQEGTRLSLVFMDNARLQSQRARLQLRQRELAEAVDRQRTAERAGL